MIQAKRIIVTHIEFRNVAKLCKIKTPIIVPFVTCGKQCILRLYEMHFFVELECLSPSSGETQHCNSLLSLVGIATVWLNNVVSSPA